MAYEKCHRCTHTWHGLPCAVISQPLVGTNTAGPCGCPSAFDDDYWQEGDTA